jgi:hypothetical protein
MNWHNLVTKNIQRNLRRYLSYLLAATLAVTVFAMFTDFVENPAVQHGHITQTAGEMLNVLRVIVALFAIFFVFYFHDALIRARNNEFGLLLTLGITPRQMGRMIFSESLLLGLFALGAGMGLGIVGSYFFLLAMGAILALPEALPFALPATTFTTTGIFFGMVFLLEAGWSALRVTRRTPRMLLLGARVQQQPPRPSWWKVALGLLSIGGAYDLALQFSTSLVHTMIPIIVLGILGTYLLFSQCAVMLLTRLRQPGISGIRLLIVARLSQRMRDYARMLTVVTVLNTVVLIGLGGVFGVLQLAEVEQALADPFALQFSVNATHATTLTPAQIQQEIARQHFTLQTLVTTQILAGAATAVNQTTTVSVMALADFEHLQQAARQVHPEFAPYQHAISPLTSDDQAYVYVPDAKQAPTFQRLQLTVGGATRILYVVHADNAGVLNDWHGSNDVGPATFVVVVSNAAYAQLANGVAPADQWQVYSYVLPNWQQSQHLVAALRQQLPDQQQSLLTDTVTAIDSFKQVLAVLLFGGFFVSCLFFLAAGSAISFKLFSQQEGDRRQFHALERIGFQRSEAGRLLSYEFLLLFFLPVTLASVHSVVALLNLANLLHDAFAARAISATFVPIFLLYLACFAAYCGISRVAYLQRMQMKAA